MMQQESPREFPPGEERFPLLMLFLEDGQRNAKKKGLFFDKTRYRGLTSGASAVLSQWPNHMSSCLFTSIICGASILLLLLIILASTVDQRLLVPRCTHREGHSPATPTTTVFLVHDDHPWQPHQLQAIETIVLKYPGCHVDLTIIYDLNNYNVTAAISPIVVETDVIDNNNGSSSSGVARTKRAVIVEQIMTKMKPSNKLLLPSLGRFVRTTTTTTSTTTEESRGNGNNEDILIGSKFLIQKLSRQQEEGGKEVVVKATTGSRGESKVEVPVIKDLSDLLKKYPSCITVRLVNKQQFFSYTPLFANWRELNANTLLFAARVVRLWDYGGISFELPELTVVVSKSNNVNVNNDNGNNGNTRNRNNNYNYNSNSNKNGNDNVNNYGNNNANVNNYGNSDNFVTWLQQQQDVVRLQRFLHKLNYDSYERLPGGVVTADDQGVHMETKTPCHAFFGEVLMNLRHGDGTTSVSYVIRKTLATFCKSGAVEASYCKNLQV